MNKPIRYELWAGGIKIDYSNSLRELELAAERYEDPIIYKIYRSNFKPEKEPKFTDEQMNKIIETHMRGISLAVIAKQHKVYYGTIVKYMRKLQYNPETKSYVRDEK